MTDDQWNNPWKDDPGRAADGGDQDQSLDRTTIRPRGDATPDSGPAAGTGSSTTSEGAFGGEAGTGDTAHSTDSPYPDSPYGTSQSGGAQYGGWQNWEQPASPASSSQKWPGEETRSLTDPYSGVNPQAGQWPSGTGQYGQPSAGAQSASQPSAPSYGQQGQPFGAQQTSEQQFPEYPGQPGQPFPGQQSSAAGYGQPPAGRYGRPGQAGQPGQPGPYGRPGAGYPAPNGAFPAPQPKAPGFFANLFDTTFAKFVSPTITKVVYIILIVLVALWYIGAVIAGFVSGPLAGIITLIVGAGAALLVIALSRMQLEYIVALIRTSEDTRELKDHFLKED